MREVEGRRTVSRPELLDRTGDDRRFRDLLYSLFAFGGSLEQARAVFARHIGLSPPQYMILIVVSHADPQAEIGVAQVAERLHLSGAFVTIEVNKLVRDGLVEKHPHSSDKRRVRLSATKFGLRQLERLAALQRPVNDALFAALDRDDFERLSDIMRRLAQGAGQAIHLANHLVEAESGGRFR